MKTWKPVSGYENEYEVSDSGDVKRIKGGKGAVIGRILKPYLNQSGYMYVTLTKQCVQTDFLLHRIVAAAFLGGSNFQINHKDGNKKNNSISNLEYVTISENLLHATRVLHKRRGDKHWNSRLSESNVLVILSLRNSGMTHQQIADAFKVSRPTISEIFLGRKWQHLSVPLISGA
mgnify:CR=1 FL=1